MSIKKLLPEVKTNIPLKNYTTFKIGGPAKYFYTAETKEDLIKATKMAKKNNLPFFILGGGSNILVADKGYKGLIIKVKSQKSKVKSTSKKSKIIEAESGVLLNQIIALALKNSLTGLEWAIGIPGTVGGAIRGNAGAFKESMKDIIKQVEVFDVKAEKIKILKNEDCQFEYRDSIFKKTPNLIILSAILKLKKGDKREIDKKMKENLDYRKKHQPLNVCSAGSIFKNPKNLFAGELIEKCGLKGRKIGQAQISKKHANFIENLGKAKTRDVKKLISLIKEKVKEKFGLELEEEIEFLGF